MAPQRWPKKLLTCRLGRGAGRSAAGFERFYGFLGAETDQWYPEITHDNHPRSPPPPPSRATISPRTSRTRRSASSGREGVAPQKPFFLYYSPGCAHAPHHVFKEWADKYRGRFNQGYVRPYARPSWPGRRSSASSLPRPELSEINPHGGPNVSGPKGQPWPQLGLGSRPWDSLSRDEKRPCSHVWPEVLRRLRLLHRRPGRAADRLPGGVRSAGEHLNQLRSPRTTAPAAKAARTGSVNENKIFNGQPDTVEANLAHIDELGRPRHVQPLQHRLAWAFDTPFPYWKRFAGYEGGLSTH